MMLSVADYHVYYGQSEIIHGLNLDVKKNEIVAILGRNGMGKTTLMKALAGMIPSSSGSAAVDGNDVSPMKSFERVKAGIALVPQGRMIFSTMTVKENIETGLTTVKDKKYLRIFMNCFPFWRRCSPVEAAIYPAANSNNWQ